MVYVYVYVGMCVCLCVRGSMSGWTVTEPMIKNLYHCQGHVTQTRPTVGSLILWLVLAVVHLHICELAMLQNRGVTKS